MSNLKVEQVLKFGDKGPSVEEARKKMLEAGEAPKGILSETRKNASVGATIRGVGGNTPVVQEPEPVAPAAEVVEAPNTAAVVEEVASVAPQTERLENAKFVLEIRQEDGQWIGEIVYKNGAGPERFTATTRKALDMKLLEGKAHGTLRLREAIRREKYGEELDKVYILPDYLTQDAFDKASPEIQQGIIDSVAVTEAVLLHQQHPEYYITEENSIRIQKFLNKRDLPFTAKNMAYAYDELSESDELEVRPTPTVVSPSVPSSAPRTVDSGAAAVPVAPVASATPAPAAPAPQVRKRATTGLRPGDTSTATAELETVTEEGQKPSEPSEAELRQLPLSELQQRARKTFKQRQF